MSDASWAHCYACHAQSRWTSAFKAVGAWPYKRVVCPWCWNRHQASVHQATFIFGLISPAIGVVLTWYGPSDARFLAIICFMLPIIAVATIAHELGHALTAELLGMRVFRVVLGATGKPILHWRLWKWKIDVLSGLCGALVQAGHPSQRHMRMKQFLMVLAGPSTNLVLAAVALWTAGFRPSSLIMEDVLWACCAANMLLAVISLIPHMSTTAIGRAPSDGLQLLTLPFASAGTVELWRSSFTLLQTAEEYECRNYESTVALCQQELQRNPTNLAIKLHMSAALCQLERFGEARDLLEDSFKDCNLDSPLGALICNNLAFADVASESAELLADADKRSAHAMAWIPWEPAIMGTRGFVLLSLGKLDEAITLLEKACDRHVTPRSKAINAAGLTIALVRQGDRDLAREMLDYARELDSQCKWVPRAEHEVLLANQLT
ncbi:MAG: site-2 protease family protein [Planctomycetes bacterium]|nr:site-2 protease family protein [Planctomycetota bacterium]